MTRNAHPTDSEVIVASGDDADRFAVLYERHAAALTVYFYRRTGCAQTAADLMAETFAAAFTSRRTFRDTGAPGRAWLFAIARRQLSHFLRSEEVARRARSRLGLEPVVLHADELERVEEVADAQRWNVAVAEALESLPDSQALAVQMRVCDQLSYRAIASSLGCTEGAARVRVSRGLVALATRMEGVS